MQNKSYINLKLYKIYSIVFFVFLCFNIQAQEINWVTLEKVVELQKTNPKNVIIDVYTNWCGPCKLMDKNTFSNPEIVDYINSNYYAVKFNAEGDEKVNFMNKTFTNPNYDESRSHKRNSSHEFTRFLGINAYPSTLFFDSQMNYISPVKGYLNPKQIEIYLHLFKDDNYKNIKSQEDFDGFVKTFKSKIEA